MKRILRAAGSDLFSDDNFVLYLSGKVGFELREQNLKKNLVLSRYVTGPVDERKIMREIVESDNNKLTSIGYNLFHLALIACKVSFIDELIADGVDLEKPTANGDYPIHLICEYPNQLHAFIKYFKNLNLRDKNGRTPLFKVIDKNGPIMVLIKHGADPNLPDFAGRKPIDAAFEIDNRIAVHNLINAGAIASPEQKRIAESFDFILSIDDVSIMEDYLKKHPYITVEESTKLIWWIIKNSCSQREYIVSRAFVDGINYMSTNENGHTLFTYALINNELDTAELIRKKADHNFVDKSYDSILKALPNIFLKETVNYLYDIGFKLRDKNYLFEFIKNEIIYKPILGHLLDKERIDGTFKSNNDETFLEAAINEDIELLRFFLERDFRAGCVKAFAKALQLDKMDHAEALINAKFVKLEVPQKYDVINDKGVIKISKRVYPTSVPVVAYSGQMDITLEEAVRKDDIEHVKALLKSGTNPNGSSPNNRNAETPLAIAAALGNMRIIEILLDAGANARLKYNSLPPSVIAERNGFPDIAKKLREHF